MRANDLKIDVVPQELHQQTINEHGTFHDSYSVSLIKKKTIVDDLNVNGLSGELLRDYVCFEHCFHHKRVNLLILGYLCNFDLFAIDLHVWPMLEIQIVVLWRTEHLHRCFR